VLDAGARGSTTTFVQRGIGDVLIAWGERGVAAVKELGPDKFDIVMPSVSILAEPPVAVVDKNAGRHHTTDVARNTCGTSIPTRARTSSRGTTTGP
jgi:sulfate transport system substrate-binding protein